MGLAKGSIVGIFAPNCAEFKIAFFGILKAGATVTTISPGYREREIAYQVQASGAQALIVHHTLAGSADLALSGTEQVKERILIAEGADVAPSFCLRPRPSDYTTNLNLSTKVLDVVQCEGLWAWATTPTMPPYHIHAVVDFGEPDMASDVSKTVLLIVKFGGPNGMILRTFRLEVSL